MDNIIITEVPILDRRGRQVGIDKISRYVNPPEEVPIQEGNVRAICTCGKIHDIPEADFQTWPTGNLEQCACSLLKV
jgi:hypothetical protein